MGFRKTILLAGDANLWGHLARSFFARDGFILLRAGDGATAFNMVEEHDPALAVIDLDLSGMAECCRRIKADPVLRVTPVLLLASSHAERDQAAVCRAAADAFLDKPLERQELLTEARRLLGIPERTGARLAVTIAGQCSRKAGKPEAGTILNLSAAGVFFATERLFPVDTRLQIRFDLPGFGALACSGRVAWVNHPEWIKKPDLPNGMGVQFLELGAFERRALTEFVDLLENGGPAIPASPNGGYTSIHGRE